MYRGHGRAGDAMSLREGGDEMWRTKKGKFGRWNKRKSKGHGAVSKEIGKKDGGEEENKNCGELSLNQTYDDRGRPNSTG